jgi:hypothetical protein
LRRIAARDFALLAIFSPRAKVVARSRRERETFCGNDWLMMRSFAMVFARSFVRRARHR